MTVSPKFKIYSSGNWVQSMNISRTRLPYTAYIRFEPSEEDHGMTQGKMTLISTEAYAEIPLFGHTNIGIIDIENSQNIIIYPNPTTGQLTIENEHFSIKGVEIFNVYGSSVAAKILSPSKNKIDLSHLPNGMYFIKIRTENGEVTKKIIKN